MATFAIDSAHTDVLFSAKHMMVTTVRGTFRDVSGTVDLDEDGPDRVAAPRSWSRAASVDTGFGARDTHLRSRRLLRCRPVPGAPRRVDGRPARRAATATSSRPTSRSATSPARSTSRSSSSASTQGMDGSRRAGFSAKAKVNRKDWGLDWNVALEAGGWLVGDKVKLEVDVAVQEALAVAATSPPDAARLSSPRRTERAVPPEARGRTARLAASSPKELICSRRREQELLTQAASAGAARSSRSMPEQKSPKT